MTPFFNFLLTCGLVISATHLFAQTICGFEAAGISIDQVINGDDLMTTEYEEANLLFPIDWNQEFSYWASGWAISSVQDSVTSGASNLFAAKAGGGYNSDTYAVGQQGSGIRYASGSMNFFSGLYISNSTYAYNSMLDGDNFAKRFGGITGNDPDFFLLTINGFKQGNMIQPKVELYLADFRFADNSQDYILKDWTFVDLSSLTVADEADSISFTLTSSDNGTFGMNTPAFFCVDDISLKPITSTQEVIVAAKVYPNPTTDRVFIDLEENKKVIRLQVVDMSGRSVAVPYRTMGTSVEVDMRGLPVGLFHVLVKTDNGQYVAKVQVQK